MRLAAVVTAAVSMRFEKAPVLGAPAREILAHQKR